MKTTFQTLNTAIGFFAGICFLISCDLDDEPPSNALGKYDLPEEVASEIFTNEVLAVTGSLEPFLDLIQQNGMKIYEGDSPPEIYRIIDFKTGLRDAQKFHIKHDCVFDANYPSYRDSVFGRYEDYFLIQKDEEGTYGSFLGYFSLADQSFPQYPDSLDTGFGVGNVSGEGNDFTSFVKVENGKYGTINYDALWIISGTYRLVDGVNATNSLSNVTKCMVMLAKTGDSQDELANVGTVRIYKDDNPTMIIRY